MKKSFFLFNALMTLFAIMLLASCDSGGGGGSGGGTAASNKSSITVKIGSSGSSADILGDFGPVQSDNFYYGVSFTGAGKTYGPEYVGKDGTLTFNDVPFGTYTFSLDIYTDNTKEITLGTKTTSASVSGSYTEVTFDLSYSEYQNFYIVSDATSLLAALRGQKINGGGSIVTSKMVAGDETTYAKIYVTEDISINDNLMEDGLFFDDSYYAVVNLDGKTITFENLSVGNNVNAVFKNGFVKAQCIRLNGFSSLSFDKINLAQTDDADGALIEQQDGTMSFSNDSTITSKQKIAEIYGGTLNLDNTTITCNGTVELDSSGSADFLDYFAIKQDNGTVVMSGGSSISTNLRMAVQVNGGSFTMDASSAENTNVDEPTAFGIYVSGGTFAMTGGSSVTSTAYGIYQTAGRVVVNDSTVIGRNYSGEYQGGGTFVLVGGTVTTQHESRPAVYMITSTPCVTALVQSYTLDGKKYTTTKPNIVESFCCYGTNQSPDAYILFGGNSTITSFDHSFYTNADSGKCYFGQVVQEAETTQSSFVSFEKSSGNMGNPRVLITTPEVVFDAGFSVIDITRDQARDLFTETTSGFWSDDESGNYYVLSY